MKLTPRPRRAGWLLAALSAGLIVAAAVLGWASLTTGHHWGDDYASYIMQARSLLDRDPLAVVRENRFTIQHSNVKLGPYAYPWGTAAILALPFGLAGFDILALKIPNFVLFLLFLAFLAWALKDELGPAESLVTVAVFSLNPAMLGFALNDVGSDLPFLVLSTVSVWLIGRVIVRPRRILSPAADHLLLGLCMGAALTVRANGALLVVTALAAQAIAWSGAWWAGRNAGRANDWLQRAVLAAVPYLVVATMGWLAYRLLPAGDGSYLAYWNRRSWPFIAGMIGYYFRLPPDFLQGVPAATAFYLASLPFLLLGAVRSLRRWHHVAIYVGLTLALVVLWPSRQGLRFLYPVLPFCVAYTVHGAAWACERLRGRGRTAAWAALLAAWLVVAGGLVVASVGQAAANLAEQRAPVTGSFTADAQAAFDQVRSATPSNSVTIFFKPRALGLFTGHRSYQASKVPNLDGGDYLLFYTGPDGYDQLPADTVEQLVAQGRLRQVYANARYRLFEITPPG